jgi:hypothetical protein
VGWKDAELDCMQELLYIKLIICKSLPQQSRAIKLRLSVPAHFCLKIKLIGIIVGSCVGK